MDIAKAPQCMMPWHLLLIQSFIGLEKKITQWHNTVCVIKWNEKHTSKEQNQKDWTWLEHWGPHTCDAWKPFLFRSADPVRDHPPTPHSFFFGREFLLRGCFYAGDLAVFTYSNKEVSSSNQRGSRFVCNCSLAVELKQADETSSGWRRDTSFGVLTNDSWVLQQQLSPVYLLI